MTFYLSASVFSTGVFCAWLQTCWIVTMPAVNREALGEVLLRISEMVCELPWIEEIDINPLIVDENGSIVADARIVVGQHAPVRGRYGHMAIRPYPARLVTTWRPPEGELVTLRPIRPEDAGLEQEFVRGLSPESPRFRFMDTLRELTPTMLVRFTQIDYDREMDFWRRCSATAKR